MLSDDKFYERALKFSLFKNTDGRYFTFDEYRELIKTNQEDKDKKVVYLYTHNEDAHHSLIQLAKNRGYDVLLMDNPIDSHFINQLEYKIENSTFVRIDADTIDNLIRKDAVDESKLSEDQKKSWQQAFEQLYDKEKYTVKFENMRETDPPVVITQDEFSRRMKEMSAAGGGFEFMGSMPDRYNAVVNTNHPLIEKTLNNDNSASQSNLVKQAVDLALLAKGLLTGQALTDFINRSLEFTKQVS